MATKLTMSQLRKLADGGVKLVDKTTGKPFDFSKIGDQPLNISATIDVGGKAEESRAVIREAQNIILKATEAMQQMVEQLKLMSTAMMNEMTEAKKQTERMNSSIASGINKIASVKNEPPKVDVKPEIKIEPKLETTQAMEWDHEVTETTQRGIPIKIKSRAKI